MAPVDRPPAGTVGPSGQQSQQRAQQRQYASKPSRSQAATPASEAADMRLEFQQQPGNRTISAPTSPAKTRDSILQRVQSLTDAAKEKASSISNDIKCKFPPVMYDILATYSTHKVVPNSQFRSKHSTLHPNPQGSRFNFRLFL